MRDQDFDEHIRAMPEPKLQLIDGRLVVGNGLPGNRQLLRWLLDGWTAEAALPMAPPDSWRRALNLGFRRFDPPDPTKPAIVWRSWAAQVTYQPDLPPAGPMIDARHNGTRTRLTLNLFGLASEHRFAHVSGRDVIMRLGPDAFTPDVFLAGPHCAGRFNKHYLDGPADLVIEILVLLGFVWVLFHSFGSMQVRIFSRKYSSSW